MKRVLLITGELAEQTVSDVADELRKQGLADAEVLALPVSVAAFMSPDLASRKLAEYLEDKNKDDYDMAIFPGKCDFDLMGIEDKTGIPCFKGTYAPSDISKVFSPEISLSKTCPADKYLEDKGISEYDRLVADNSSGGHLVAGLPIGSPNPPRILAEIIDATLMSNDQILSRAEYFLKSGADMLDVGCSVKKCDSGRAGEIVGLLKSKFNCPISIDSLDPAEIKEAISSGADLVLSLTADNISKLDPKDDVSYVVIPYNKSSLEETFDMAEKRGFKNLIADFVLAPPFKTLSSLCEYERFVRHNPDVPILLGVGNVVEMIDADSIGVNAILASFATEMSAAILLSTENSDKTRNSIAELKRAVQMSHLAKVKGTLPKDLGFDLLIAKSKSVSKNEKMPGNIVRVSNSKEDFLNDPAGYFRIYVDLDTFKILAAYHGKKGDITLSGTDSETISKEIIRRGLVSELSHAAYLGRELSKAELFLKLRKGYVQDEDFKGL